MVIIDWKLIHRVSVPGGCTVSKCMLLPGFDENKLPIVLDYGTYDPSRCSKESTSFDIVNVRTGRREKLIQSSAQNDPWGRQRAVFFTERDGIDNISLNFSSVQLTRNNEFEQTWHRLDLYKDCMEILRNYGRLPFQTINEVKDAMVKVGEHDKYKLEIEELK